MAWPIAGTCDVQTVPTSLRHRSVRRSLELRAECFDAQPRLLRSYVLHAEPEDPCQLREVIDVTAGLEQCEHVAAPDSSRCSSFRPNRVQ